MTLDTIKSYLKRINPRSPILIVGAFSVVLLLLIALTVRSRVADQEQLNTIARATPTPADTFVPKSEIVQGQINVKFKEGITDVQINNLLLKYNSRIKSTISGINVKVIDVPVGQEETIRQALSKDPIVKYAEPDHVAHGTFTPNDTNFENQYGFNNKGQSIKGTTGKANADIHIQEAWDTTKGKGMTVAVLDTGLDLSHPEFSGGKVGLQKVFVTGSIDDGFGHGTHTAGIVSANTNNSTGIAGACPDCSLMIGKVLDDSGNGPYSVIAQGITWATDNGAKVISMSLGGYDNDQTLKEATDYAWSKGAIIVAAAGNDNTTNKFYPGGDPHVVTVAATDNNDQKASFSNYGDWVMVAAPGKDIFSTMPTHSYALQSRGLASNYDYLSGTSMATPMVSGVVAMIWTTSYGTSNQAVVDRLYSTADQISGTGNYWQKGRINAAAAVSGDSPKGVKGVVDKISCTKVRGWAFDSKASDKSIGVHIYINGAVGTPNAQGYDTGSTSVDRPDVNKTYSISGTHGFDWQLPSKYKDGSAHDVFVYAIDSQGGTNPEIGHGNTGKCSQSTDPTTTIAPTVMPITPVPTFVCGGSKDSICNPTGTITPRPTNTQNPTITQAPGVTGEPTITPAVTPVPESDCLDPRSNPQKIQDWLNGFLKKINNYIQLVLGNPQSPRPAPPTPCIKR